MFGVGADEAPVGHRVDVAKLTQDVHRLVIAHQDNDLAAGCGCLILQPHEEVDCATDVFAIVNQVTRLDQDGVAPRPVVLGVDHFEVLEERGNRVGRALDLAEDENFTFRRCLPANCDRLGRHYDHDHPCKDQ